MLVCVQLQAGGLSGLRHTESDNQMDLCSCLAGTGDHSACCTALALLCQPFTAQAQ